MEGFPEGSFPTAGPGHWGEDWEAEEDPAHGHHRPAGAATSPTFKTPSRAELELPPTP